MNITLSLHDDLVKEVRKIAVERDTTLTGLVRSYLQELAAEHAKSGRKRRELEALEESFRTLQFNMGEKTWTREDFYERGSHKQASHKQATHNRASHNRASHKQADARK